MKNITSNESAGFASARSQKTRIGFLFGGRSGEHEISVLSAASVMGALSGGYEAVPFGITKDGEWRLVTQDLSGLASLDDPRMAHVFDGSRAVTIADFDAMADFAFPVLHGPFGEDGTVQGVFEMLGKPYAGCGVAASAISMDKIFTKEVWRQAGLPVGGYAYTTAAACGADFAGELDRLEKALGHHAAAGEVDARGPLCAAGDACGGGKTGGGNSRTDVDTVYPLYVKPANMGSSVGISQAHCREGLGAAVRGALRYDRRVIVEKTIKGRELEVALLGNGAPRVSAIGEIMTCGEYYDYDRKYKGGGTRLSVPADITDEEAEAISAIAARAYMALDGAGFSRIDLFLREGAAGPDVVLSEMNAIPGFTQFSMFPRLWGESGIGYGELIERIIRLGYERHNA